MKKGLFDHHGLSIQKAGVHGVRSDFDPCTFVPPKLGKGAKLDTIQGGGC